MFQVSGNDKLEWVLCSKNLHSEKVDNDDCGVKALDDTDGNDVDDDNDVDEDSLVDGNWHSLDCL